MNKSYVIALLIAVLGAVWIGSGILFPSEENQKQPTSQSTADAKADNRMKLQVRTVNAVPYMKKITLSGRSQASKNVTMKAEANGQVTDIIRDEGEKVTKGDEIIKIDVRERQERVREARELVKQRKIEYDAARRLIKQGFASDVKLAQTQSAYESARASLKAAEIELEKTTISAPFDGVLGQRYVDIGDYVSVGTAIADIVDLTPLEVSVYVNEKEVVQIHKGDAASLRFANGRKVEGVVSFIAPAANEETRTFRVKIETDNAGEEPLPAGLTAQVDISIDSQPAYQIPPSVITLDDEGNVGVKTVGADNIVSFKPIEILEDTPDHLWVTGLVDGDRVVMVGQDFVIAGQKVETTESSETSSGQGAE